MKINSQLLVVGSVAYDSIQTPFGKVNKALGGSASYISLASRYFANPQLVAVAGEDFSQVDIATLKKNNVDLSGLEIKPGKTFKWGGKYQTNLNIRETLFTELGVFENFQPKLLPEHKNLNYIFLGNIHPNLQLEVLKQINFKSQNKKFVGLDTMNFWIEKSKPELLKVLKLVDILIINDSEAFELSGEQNLLKSAKKILGMMQNTSQSLPINKKEVSHSPSFLKRGLGGVPTLIIKRGEYGLTMFQFSSPSPFQKGRLGGVLNLKSKISRLQSPEAQANGGQVNLKSLNIFSLPALPLEKVVDPTGAGDSFAGGFMGYLAKTNNTSWANLKKACVYGSVMASFCVENFGTKNLQNLKVDKILNRVKDFETLTKFQL